MNTRPKPGFIALGRGVAFKVDGNKSAFVPVVSLR